VGIAQRVLIERRPPSPAMPPRESEVMHLLHCRQPWARIVHRCHSPTPAHPPPAKSIHNLFRTLAGSGLASCQRSSTLRGA
jgi:hypothetical protein